jgi:hypothetical protein
VSTVAPPNPDTTWQIARGSKAGTCTAMMNTQCPEGAICNPPPPSDYACPTNREAMLSLPNTLTRKAGLQQCTMDVMESSSSTGGCPAGAHCNPPPPHHTIVTLPCPRY